MGNFNHLAQPILKKVSSCPCLAEETGNFCKKTGNIGENSFLPFSQQTLEPCEVSKETFKETDRKLDPKTEETFTQKITPKNFLSQPEISSPLDYFFNNVFTFFGIELLPDDRRWIRTICYGISKVKLITLLEEYIFNWHQAMVTEKVGYKKQNTGRFLANTRLRESLNIKL